MDMRHTDHAVGRGDHGNDPRMRPGRGNPRHGPRGQGRGGRQHSARGGGHDDRGGRHNQAEAFSLAQLQQALQHQQHQHQQPRQQHAQSHESQGVYRLQGAPNSAPIQHHAQQPVQQYVQQPMQRGAFGGSGGSIEESSMDWGALSIDDSPMKPPSWGASVATTTAGVGYNPNAHEPAMQGRSRAAGMGSGRGSVPHGALFAQAMGNASRAQQQGMGADRVQASNVRAMGGGHHHVFDQHNVLNASHAGRGMGQGRTHGGSEPMVAVPLQALGGSMCGMGDMNAGANMQHAAQQGVNVQNSTAHTYKQGSVHSLEMASMVENSIGENLAKRGGMPRSPQGPHADGVGFGRFGAGGQGIVGRAGHVGGRGGLGEGRLDNRLQSSETSEDPINPRAEMMLGAMKDMYDLTRLDTRLTPNTHNIFRT